MPTRDTALEWRVYYDDGSTFDNLKGGPADAPALGVIAINCADADVGFWTARAADFYCYSETQFTPLWEGMDMFGLWDYLASPGLKRVLFGRTIPNDRYEQILHVALRDPDFPKKTGWRTTERPVEGVIVNG